MHFAVIMGVQRPRKKRSRIFSIGIGTTCNLAETKTYINQITKWYVTEMFSAALPPTEALKVRLITSHRYASVPFLGRLPHET